MTLAEQHRAAADLCEHFRLADLYISTGSFGLSVQISSDGNGDPAARLALLERIAQATRCQTRAEEESGRDLRYIHRAGLWRGVDIDCVYTTLTAEERRTLDRDSEAMDRDRAAAAWVNSVFAEMNARPAGTFSAASTVVRHIDTTGPCACDCRALCEAPHDDAGDAA